MIAGIYEKRFVYPIGEDRDILASFLALTFDPNFRLLANLHSAMTRNGNYAFCAIYC